MTNLLTGKPPYCIIKHLAAVLVSLYIRPQSRVSWADAAVCTGSSL